MDPLRHPDLVEISRRLRHQLDAVLAAEQQAAMATLRRRRTIRDRLIEAEDRAENVSLKVATGEAVSGRLVAVGADHLVISTPHRETFVHLDHIASCAFEV